MTVADLPARLQTRAADVDVLRLLLTVLVLPLFLIGWLAGQTVRLLVMVGAWAVAAVREGYDVARTVDGDS